MTHPLFKPSSKPLFNSNAHTPGDTTIEDSSILKTFFQATRPRTFPLAVASIVCGTGLAFIQLNEQVSQPSNAFSAHHWLIFALTLWVALALQILSNLANDYGDGVKGTDSLRASDSPKRMTATGKINPTHFKRLIFGWALLTFCSGVLLIGIGFESWRDFALFLGFGILAIIAAMAYTMGKRPYGYRAMGEVAVLIFFGWLGVLGSAYLQTQQFTLSHLLPATGCGALAACVLYVNNMRDHATDRLAGKVTLAVLLGPQRMTRGYLSLFSFALTCYLLYGLLFNFYTLVWLITLPLVINHLRQVIHAQEDTQTSPIGAQLKTIVLLTLIINLLFVTGLLISRYFNW